MLDDDFEFWDVSDEVYNAIRAAELAAEGAALRASARAALMHRVALALLGVSLLLSLAMLLLPVLRPWYGQAPWVLIWGVLAYFVIAAIAYWSRPRTSAPELRRLRRIRQGIASLLRDLQTARGSRQDPVLIRALTDAIDLLDEQLIPALQELVQRRSNLEKQLARYERGQLPSPDPAILARLQEIYRRQQAAIVDCERQAANAHATLVALLQEGDDGSIALRARAWADGLATLYDSLNEVLHGTDDATRSDTGGARQEPERPGPAATSPVPGNRPNDVDVVYVRQVEGALIALHDLGKLSVCELMSQIPLTIAAICKDRRNGHGGYPTSLEQAQALSDVLRAAVERLSPGDAPEDRHTSDRVLAAQVLADRYLRGLSPRQIMSRRNISESTVHRYRREGIRVVARELHEQEALYERDTPDPPVP